MASMIVVLPLPFEPANTESRADCTGDLIHEGDTSLTPEGSEIREHNFAYAHDSLRSEQWTPQQNNRL